MNAGKSKVMVGSSCGKMIKNSGKQPAAFVGNECRQTLFSAHYVKNGFTSGVRGDLSRATDGFRRCDGPIQEANLAEDLMVDGETYGELLLSGRHTRW